MTDGETGIDHGGSDAPPGTGSDGAPTQPKKRKASRGIETMFRTNYRTHLELSQLADTKANIMISINGLIISVLIASLSGNLSGDPVVLLPAAVVLLACLGSLVFSILAARPRVSSEIRGQSPEDAAESNILFFGNFVHLEEEVFVEGIEDLMSDPDRLYPAMARDIYGLGLVLDRKYRLIRLAYNIFMGGLGLGVTAFVGVLLFSAG